MPRKRRSSVLLRDHSTELINGRSMLCVCLLYDDLEHGKEALSNLLTDYKKHQDEIRKTFSECVENLIEFRKEDQEEVDYDRINLIKQIFEEISSEVWRKRRRAKVPRVPAPVEPVKNDEEDSAKEDEWEKRFASGEFDL